MEVSSTESKEQGAGGKEHESVPELVEGEKKSSPFFGRRLGSAKTRPKRGLRLIPLDKLGDQNKVFN